MGEAFSASTSGIDPAERVAFWNAGSGRIGGVSAQALSDLFDARVTMRQLDPLCVYRLESTPHHVTTNAIRTGPARMLRLRYQQTGTSLVFQGQRSFRLSAGDWMISDPHQAHSAVNEGDVSHLWLQIPCNSLSAQDVAAAHAAGKPLDISSTLGGALREAMLMALDSTGDMPAAAGHDLAATMIAAVQQALRAVPAAPAGLSTREETARRARAYIDRHLHDPDLTVDRIARVLGCTPRYLHKIFEGSESVCRYIWNQRLEKCRNQLAQHPGQTLTALAFDYGFNSSSHFSRSFRERFGTTPSAYQATMQQARA